MKILVFVKQVPDTVDVKIDPQTGNICRDGVKSVVNPYDLNAIEAALQLKESCGATVSVVSMGPPQAESALLHALSMGCDEAFLLSDRAFGGADTLATGYVLAKAVEKIADYDLLIFGKCATDAETAQTGPIVAEFLGLPQVTFADSLEVKEGWAYCRRDLGSHYEDVKVKLPAVVAVTSNINTPRYPTAKGIMSRNKKPRHVWNLTDLGADPEKTGVKGSPSINKKIFEPPKHSTDTVYFSGDVKEMASSLADVLAEAHLI